MSEVAPAVTSVTATGPLIWPQHRERVVSYIEKGQAEGARLVLDGRQHPHMPRDKGFFLGPTIFDHGRPEMTIAQEEIFGLVLSVIRVKALDEPLPLVLRHSARHGGGSPAQEIFRGAWFRRGASEVHVILADDTTAPPGLPDSGPARYTGLATHLAFEVDDLDAVVEHLQRHAVPIFGGPVARGDGVT